MKLIESSKTIKLIIFQNNMFLRTFQKQLILQGLFRIELLFTHIQQQHIFNGALNSTITYTLVTIKWENPE
jgi:hypothetical protein